MSKVPVVFKKYTPKYTYVANSIKRWHIKTIIPGAYELCSLFQ